LLSTAAADMALTWSDCGDETFHSKISAVTPSSLAIGETVTIKGIGNLDQDIDEGVTFNLAMEGQFTDCQGTASVGAKCNFPLDMGSIEFLGLESPYKAGNIPINVDLKISKLLPASLLETTTQVTGTGVDSGNKVFCLNVYTKKSPDSTALKGILDVTWADCGDDDTKSKIHTLSPSQLTKGTVNHIQGIGLLAEDVNEEIHFESSMRIAFLNCAGDGTVKKKCNFPLDLGSIEFEGIPTPIKAGAQEIDVNLKLGKLIPDGTISTTHVTAVTASGMNVFCLDVNTAASVSNTTVV